MQFIVFDLEATCWDGNQMGREQEIIEIGALRLNMYGHQESRFQNFVRPVRNPTLSVYCRQLTGISQNDVDTAKDFSATGSRFIQWIEQAGEEYRVCSWGYKDKLLLSAACEMTKLETDWLESYVDLKAQYHDIKGLQRRAGLKKCLQREGIPFEGNHHRALDDAENLSRLFVRYLDMWVF